MKKIIILLTILLSTIFSNVAFADVMISRSEINIFKNSVDLNNLLIFLIKIIIFICLLLIFIKILRREKLFIKKNENEK